MSMSVYTSLCDINRFMKYFTRADIKKNIHLQNKTELSKRHVINEKRYIFHILI